MASASRIWCWLSRATSPARKAISGFETLTHVPIDRELVDVALLMPDERAWNAYHARTLAMLSPQLEGADRWLAGKRLRAALRGLCSCYVPSIMSR
jgi:hypothetical protein